MLTDRLVCIGIDPGDDTVFAVVALAPRSPPTLLHVFEVYGVPEAWDRRLDEAIAGVAREVAYFDHVWLEVPEATIRRSAKMAHHAAGVGLGRRIGAVERAWRDQFGTRPETVTTGTWWKAWLPTLRLHPKKEETHGVERIEQAAGAVVGARLAVERITSADRRVDASEAILIAAAACLALRTEHAEADLRTRALASGQRLPADFMAQVKAADKTRGGKGGKGKVRVRW